MIASAREWWNGREPREQVLLGVLAALLGVFVLVFALVLPVLDARASAQSALNRAEGEMRIVSQVAPGATTDTAARQPFSRSVLLSAARDQGLSVTRIQAAGEGGFAVWIDDANTQGLYAMLDTLVNGSTATLERVIITTNANDKLSAQFTVR